MMKWIAQFDNKYRRALLSGFLMGTSYIPFPPWALLFCWVPLWLDLVEKDLTPKEAFKRAWVTQFVLSLIGFHWVSYVAHEFGFLPWSVSILVLLLFAAVVHLSIPLAAAAAVYLKQRFRLPAPAVLVLLALFHNLGEIYWPALFAWNLGYPLLWIHSPWAQWSDLIGFLGLSLIVHLLNALVASLILAKDSKKSLLWALPLAAVFALCWWLGAERKKFYEAQATHEIRVNVIQANIGNLEKYYAERGTGYQQEIIEKYFRMTSEADKKWGPADLTIWPESAIPEFLDTHNRERKYSSLFFAELQNIKGSLITGAYSNDPPLQVPREDYNSMFLLEPGKDIQAEPYHKTQLLAYGEYVPGAQFFPILRKWNPGGEGFGRGSGPMVFSWRDFKIGAQICYESLDPQFTSELIEQGASFLVNITNDSWFGPRSEPKQHLYMTLARAIEARRPLIRSTNTGITGFIDAAGNISELSPLFVEWTTQFKVPIPTQPEITFYTKFGHWLPLIHLLVLGMILGRYRRGSSRLGRDS